jgi:hypothetical protein
MLLFAHHFFKESAMNDPIRIAHPAPALVLCHCRICGCLMERTIPYSYVCPDHCRKMGFGFPVDEWDFAEESICMERSVEQGGGFVHGGWEA